MKTQLDKVLCISKYESTASSLKDVVTDVTHCAPLSWLIDEDTRVIKFYKENAFDIWLNDKDDVEPDLVVEPGDWVVIAIADNELVISTTDDEETAKQLEEELTSSMLKSAIESSGLLELISKLIGDEEEDDDDDCGIIAVLLGKDKDGE